MLCLATDIHLPYSIDKVAGVFTTLLPVLRLLQRFPQRPSVPSSDSFSQSCRLTSLNTDSSSSG